MASPRKDWRQAPSAGRRYGDGCRCHAQALGHLFNRDLECLGCGRSWYEQQTEPLLCPDPPDHQVFRTKAARPG